MSYLDKKTLEESLKSLQPAGFRVERSAKSYQEVKEYRKKKIEEAIAEHRSLSNVRGMTDRLIRKTIAGQIRDYHSYCTISTKTPHYIQVGIDKKTPGVEYEHVIPVRMLVEFALHGTLTPLQVLNAPICLVSYDIHKKIAKQKNGSRNHNSLFFFQRYRGLDIQIRHVRHNQIIDINTWDLNQHIGSHIDIM